MRNKTTPAGRAGPLKAQIKIGGVKQTLTIDARQVKKFVAVSESIWNLSGHDEIPPLRLTDTWAHVNAP